MFCNLQVVNISSRRPSGNGNISSFQCFGVLFCSVLSYLPSSERAEPPPLQSPGVLFQHHQCVASSERQFVGRFCQVVEERVRHTFLKQNETRINFERKKNIQLTSYVQKHKGANNKNRWEAVVD